MGLIGVFIRVIYRRDYLYISRMCINLYIYIFGFRDIYGYILDI